MTWAFPERLHPEAGKFYRTTSGQIWCCYRAAPLVKAYGVHTQSYCIKVNDHERNYFLDDRSWNGGGETDQELVEEVSVEEAQRYATEHDALSKIESL